MQRIPAVDPATAPAPVAATLNAVKAKLGMIPNLVKVMAQSQSVLDGYLAIAAATDAGGLSAPLREQIALLSAGTNGCDYCASAHHLLGKRAGLEDSEISGALSGSSKDAKSAAALAFAKAVLLARGRVADTDLAAVRAAGFSDGEILEIVANVVVNIFTNYVNNVADTDIDFPRVTVSKAAA